MTEKEAAVDLPVPPPRFADHGEISDVSLLAEAPLVSVLVITYRHETVLAECIEGIASQKVDFPIEIVIAEDNSPDATRDVAVRLQRKYPHLVRVVFTADNKGGTTNSVFGIAMCRGAFIAPCDGDDFWIDDDKLARQVAALRRLPNVDMAFTSGYRLYPDGRREPDWDWGDAERVVSARELFSTLGWTAPPASLMFRADVPRNLPDFFESTAFGDFTIILAGSVRGGAFYDPARAICYRLAHPSSFTLSVDNATRRDRIRFFEGAIRQLRLTCRHYGFPVRFVSHRINDYRLELVRLQLAERRWPQALRSAFGLSPIFLIRGLGRRLMRRLQS